MAAITGPRAGGRRSAFGIGALAEASGVAIETIRFWERQGLVPPAPRAANGRRLYGREAIDRLRFIRHARALGFPLREIRTLLALAESEAGGCAAAQALASRHLAAVRDRIDRLRRMEAVLEATLERCARGETHCPLIAALAEVDGTLDALPAEPGPASGEP